MPTVNSAKSGESPLRSRRTCFRCRDRRTECDGSQPCGLCKQKHDRCRYPISLRLTTNGKNESGITNTKASRNISSLPPPEYNGPRHHGGPRSVLEGSDQSRTSVQLASPGTTYASSDHGSTDGAYLTSATEDCLDFASALPTADASIPIGVTSSCMDAAQKEAAQATSDSPLPAIAHRARRRRDPTAALRDGSPKRPRLTVHAGFSEDSQRCPSERTADPVSATARWDVANSSKPESDIRASEICRMVRDLEEDANARASFAEELRQRAEAAEQGRDEWQRRALMVRGAYRKLCKLVAQRQRAFQKEFPSLGKKKLLSIGSEKLPSTCNLANDNHHSTDDETIVVDTQGEHCESSTGSTRTSWPKRPRKARELAQEIVDMESHLEERLKLVEERLKLAEERLKLAEERLNRMKSSGRDFCYVSKNIAVESAFNWSEDKPGDKSVDEPAGG